MNEKELAEIEERAAKATEGRWIFQKAWATSDILDNTGADIAGNVERRNAAFIAHARQDIPALLAEVERLKAALLYYATSIDDGGAIARNALKGGAKLQELIKDAKSMCVICGGPDWTHGARNHEYKGGSS